MSAKLFSASISILCLYFLHCPQAKAAASSLRFSKAQKTIGCQLAAVVFCSEEDEPADGSPAAFVQEEPFVSEPLAYYGAAGAGPELPAFGARSFLFRSGLSPPSFLV
jgi:hypothetical protein